MNVRMKKFLLCTVLSVLIPCLSFAADKTLANANRRTAARFLTLAENALAEKDWTAAYSQAQLGLSYDETVADLWYIEAAALSGRGAVRADVLPPAQHAVDGGCQWVHYNRDAARMLYADLLCDTGRYNDAISVLDADPFVYSADAEYIRIKSYYRIHTDDALAKARDRVNAARRIYPADMRFPRLFFRYEYANRKPAAENAGDVDNSIVQNIADSFIARMPDYDNPDAELEIYAALFSQGTKRDRLLAAFNAHRQEHPLYAGAAVTAGLLTQSQALSYFFKFAATTIDMATLENFIPMITDDAVKQQLAAALNAYNGLLTIDTDGDLEPNMYVHYERGRPQSILWDRDNDGIAEWNVRCDFGVPVSVELPLQKLSLQYGTYPAIVQAAYGADAEKSVFEFTDNVFSWTPCTMEIPEQFALLSGCSFFVPVLAENQEVPGSELFIASASRYVTPTTERQNAVASFSLIDGKPVSAEYSVDGKIYARTIFTDGLPTVRSVDSDGDGVFETAQQFGFDPADDFHQADGERAQIADELFNIPGYVKGIYLKSVQIDENGDTVADFTEEYLADGGKISSWDNDGDGLWDIQYKRFPQKTGERLFEDSSFYLQPGRTLITVTMCDGQPVKVMSDGTEYPVASGTTTGFYWIGTAGSPEDEMRAVLGIGEKTSVRDSCIVETENMRMLVVRVGQNIFAQRISSAPAAVDETAAPDGESNAATEASSDAAESAASSAE